MFITYVMATGGPTQRSTTKSNERRKREEEPCRATGTLIFMSSHITHTTRHVVMRVKGMAIGGHKLNNGCMLVFASTDYRYTKDQENVQEATPVIWRRFH
jgi:1,4-dihydroxy-2-naphthoyl-CoA synthase